MSGGEHVVRVGDLGILRIDQPHGDVDPFLLHPHPQKLPGLEVDRIDVRLAALELALQDQAVGENGGRWLRGPAEQRRQQQEKPRDATESRREPARNGRDNHPLFSLGG